MFDVLTVVNMKNADVCDATPYILVDIYQSSGVIFRIDSQYKYFKVFCVLLVIQSKQPHAHISVFFLFYLYLLLCFSNNQYR